MSDELSVSRPLGSMSSPPRSGPTSSVPVRSNIQPNGSGEIAVLLTGAQMPFSSVSAVTARSMPMRARDSRMISPLAWSNAGIVTSWQTSLSHWPSPSES